MPKAEIVVEISSKSRSKAYAQASIRETIRRIAQMVDELTGKQRDRWGHGNDLLVTGADGYLVSRVTKAFEDLFPWPGQPEFSGIEKRLASLPPPRILQRGEVLPKAEAKAESRNTDLKVRLGTERSRLISAQHEHLARTRAMGTAAQRFLGSWILEQLSEGRDPLGGAPGELARTFASAWLGGWRPRGKQG